MIRLGQYHLKYFKSTSLFYCYHMIMCIVSPWNMFHKQEPKIYLNYIYIDHTFFFSTGSRSTSKVHKHSRRYKRQLNNNNIQNNNPKDPRVLRKEYRMLNDEERYRLHRAMNVLKNTFMDGLSMYDVFVHQHQASVAPAAHFGPAFLGYHRELLLRYV